jgi:hypothetical protein
MLLPRLCLSRYAIFVLLGLHLPASAGVLDAPDCAATIKDLRVLLGDQTFPLKWEETTMSDGKPLLVSIVEKEGALSLQFIKTSEGLWAQAAGVLCKAGSDFEVRFAAEQVRVGPAAHWVLRFALGGGGKFTLTTLGANQLRIATNGWSGTFSPVER